jgi:hypothetical protein
LRASLSKVTLSKKSKRAGAAFLPRLSTEMEGEGLGAVAVFRVRPRECHGQRRVLDGAQQR